MIKSFDDNLMTSKDNMQSFDAIIKSLYDILKSLSVSTKSFCDSSKSLFLQCEFLALDEVGQDKQGEEVQAADARVALLEAVPELADSAGVEAEAVPEGRWQEAFLGVRSEGAAEPIRPGEGEAALGPAQNRGRQARSDRVRQEPLRQSGVALPLHRQRQHRFHHQVIQKRHAQLQGMDQAEDIRIPQEHVP